VWEAEWLAAVGRHRLLLQGLIQVAAALYKAARRERAAGCAQLLTAGLAKLDRFADGETGLALEEFRDRVEKALERAVAWKGGGPPLDSRSFPRLRVSQLRDS
jgi:predicted metal-dependent hydrolase